MKIKKNLVCDKYTGEIVGFTSLGSINDELLQLERECQGEKDTPQLANHALALMVRGIFFKMDFPYAHFGTTDLTADILSPLSGKLFARLNLLDLK